MSVYKPRSRLSTNSGLETTFQLIQKERMEGLMNLTRSTLLNDIIPLLLEELKISESLLGISNDLITNIVTDIVNTGEQELYGVRGGTLVVYMGNKKSELGRSTRTNIGDTRTKLGAYKFDASIISTYELHLTIFPSLGFACKLTNILRKVAGNSAKLVLSEKFILEKKKLYC